MGFISGNLPRMNPYKSSQSVTSLHRCFYALRPPSDVIDYLSEIMDSLHRHQAKVRWTPQRSIHLTLRFLGELDETRFAAARNFAPVPAIRHPIRLRADGLGAFPSLRAPRVLWAGVSTASPEDLDHLQALQASTERHARAIGLEPEPRRFRPHLTLGRIPFPSSGLRSLIDDITTRECRSPLCDVHHMVLMKSRIASSGAEYEVVESWTMTG